MAVLVAAVQPVRAFFRCCGMLVGIIASTLLTVQNAGAADTGTCTITEAGFAISTDEKTGRRMGRFLILAVGQVYRLGSLSIRVAGRNYETFEWLLDLKAPGFAASNQPLSNDKPVTYTICGQEVSVTVSQKLEFDAYALIVSVF